MSTEETGTYDLTQVTDPECLTTNTNLGLCIENKEIISEQRTPNPIEDVPSPCSADTTDAEVEELYSGHQQQHQSDVTDINRPVDVVTPPLPEGCKPLSHQVAGHIHGKGKTKAGLLQDCDGAILKPIQTQSRGKKERKFYFNISKADQSDPVLSGIRPFVPHFYGTYIDPGNPEMVYLKIDDVTKNFCKPCIMDVKIGLQSWEEGAPPEKVKQAMLKYPYMKTVGFQILGMRVFHPATGEYEYQDKYYGRLLDQSTVIEGLARFFNVEENPRLDALVVLLDKLEKIKDWFEGQQKYHFFSSSLLLVYEGDITALTVHGASGDNLPSRACENDSNVVSYSTLAMSDSESILTASRNLNIMSNKTDNSSTVEVNRGVEPNGYVTRLPSYKESQQASRLQNGAVDINGEIQGGDHICSAISQGFQDSNQRGLTMGLGVSQGENDRGVTVAQMREMQQRLQGPGGNQSVGSSHDMSSVDAHDWLNAGNSKTSQPRKGESNGVDHSNRRRLLADVKMIDFTHVVDVNTTDENYLVGLRNLIRQLRTLLECHSS